MNQEILDAPPGLAEGQTGTPAKSGQNAISARVGASQSLYRFPRQVCIRRSVFSSSHPLVVVDMDAKPTHRYATYFWHALALAAERPGKLRLGAGVTVPAEWRSQTWREALGELSDRLQEEE